MQNATAHKNLVLVTNSSEANLFSCENIRTENLTLIKNFSHPDSRKKVSDLVSDRPGHFQTDGGAHGAFEKGDPKRVEADHFALELVKFIKDTIGSISNTKLIVVSPSHFSILIKKHLGSHIKDLICIPKDYTKYTPKELLDFLRETI